MPTNKVSLIDALKYAFRSMFAVALNPLAWLFGVGMACTLTLVLAMTFNSALRSEWFGADGSFWAYSLAITAFFLMCPAFLRIILDVYDQYPTRMDDLLSFMEMYAYSILFILAYVATAAAVFGLMILGCSVVSSVLEIMLPILGSYADHVMDFEVALSVGLVFLFMSRFHFAPFLIADYDINPLQAMRQSWKVCRGNSVKILVLALVLMFCVFTLFLVIRLGWGFFDYPLTAALVLLGAVVLAGAHVFIYRTLLPFGWHNVKSYASGDDEPQLVDLLARPIAMLDSLEYAWEQIKTRPFVILGSSLLICSLAIVLVYLNDGLLVSLVQGEDVQGAPLALIGLLAFLLLLVPYGLDFIFKRLLMAFYDGEPLKAELFIKTGGPFAKLMTAYFIIGLTEYALCLPLFLELKLPAWNFMMDNYLGLVVAAYIFMMSYIFVRVVVFLPFVFLDEEIRPLHAIARSWRLSRGNAMMITLLTVIAGAGILAGLMILGIGLVFAYAFFNIVLTHAYRSLKPRWDVEPEEYKPPVFTQNELSLRMRGIM